MLATALACSTKRRILRPLRSIKVLGTPFGGGMRRSAKVLKTRLKAFKQKVGRIHAMRKQHINTLQLVRAMGAPGMLYGIDVVGASDTHLHAVRVAALRAATPPGASRNVDVAFAVLDARAGNLDPAYMAHITPVKHWCLALWQAWESLEELESAFNRALKNLTAVKSVGRSVWTTVSGPVGAVIASVWRLGWHCSTFRRFTDDAGDVLDLLNLSPGHLVDAVGGARGGSRPHCQQSFQEGLTFPGSMAMAAAQRTTLPS